MWPFFTYKRDDKNIWFGLPSLCPYRYYDAIERNYGPLWTFYSHSRGELGYEDEVLWGLIRWRRFKGGATSTTVFPFVSYERQDQGAPAEWSILKGLLARERDEKGVRMRLFYGITWHP